MTDPSEALPSLQDAILNGTIELKPGHADANLYVHFDTPNGEKRITCVMLEGKTVTAMQHGLGQNGVRSFYIRAIVDVDNQPSRRVAEQTIDEKPETITERISGKSALKYIRLIETVRSKA